MSRLVRPRTMTSVEIGFPSGDREGTGWRGTLELSLYTLSNYEDPTTCTPCPAKLHHSGWLESQFLLTDP